MTNCGNLPPWGAIAEHKRAMEPMSSEHPSRTAPKTPISENSRETGTESGTPNAQNASLDPDLALIQDRWSKLPEHIKAAVLALVRSITDKEQTP